METGTTRHGFADDFSAAFASYAAEGYDIRAVDNHPLHDAFIRAIGRNFPPMRRCGLDAGTPCRHPTRERRATTARSLRATPSVDGFDAPSPTSLKDHP